MRDGASNSDHTEQYAEFGGHRGFYREGWKLLSLHRDPDRVDDPEWELYDVTTDPAETHDVAAEHPDVVAELACAWDEAAWRNTVFPLYDSPADQGRRRPDEERYSDPVRILAGTPTLERYRSSKLIAYRDFDIEIELRDWTRPDEGVLVAHGDPQGGYLLYIEDGTAHFVFNSYGRIARVSGELPDGVDTVVLRAVATPQVRWDFVLEASSGGQVEVIAKLDNQFQLVGMAPWTGISVGLDARGPVDLDLRERRGVFRFGSALRAVTYRPGAVRVPAAIRREIDESAEYHAD